MSKTHALFVPASDGVLVTDLGSTNGTHVEDEEGVHRLSPGRAEYVHRGRQAYLGDGVCRPLRRNMMTNSPERQRWWE